MTSIIETINAPDGLDVRVVRENGQRHTFHFLTLPADLQATVAELDARLTTVESEAMNHGS